MKKILSVSKLLSNGHLFTDSEGLLKGLSNEVTFVPEISRKND